MVFTLVLALVVGGFVLLYPLSKRLGVLLEEKVRQQKGGIGISQHDVQALREKVDALEVELRVSVERQQFVEQLLSRRGPDQLGKPPTE
jgi:hypothetical protein